MAHYYVAAESEITLNSMKGQPTNTRMMKYVESIKEQKLESLRKGYGCGINYGEGDFNPHLKENWDPTYYDLKGIPKQRRYPNLKKGKK